MNVLLKKLSRTIRSTMGQYLVVTAVVTVGITVYISMTTCYYNLNRSRDQFYRENNFADYYFHVVRAPEQVAGQIAALPGVAAVSGRIQKDVPLVKEGKQGSQRATARITSYPVPVEGANRIQLLSGKMFEEYPREGVWKCREKMSALGVAQRRVPVIISLDETANLKPGFEVKVAVETSTRQNVLLAPLESVITREDGLKEVMAVTNNLVTRRAVITGINAGKTLK